MVAQISCLIAYRSKIDISSVLQSLRLASFSIYAVDLGVYDQYHDSTHLVFRT
jgi:hypothetical protein